MPNKAAASRSVSNSGAMSGAAVVASVMRPLLFCLASLDGA
jgi:hypothetical protein